MPASVEVSGPSPREPEPPPGQGLAVLAVSLYLANLLVIPVLGFLALAWLFLRCDRDTPLLAQAHIHQAFSASLWAGVLLVLVNLLIILFGGYRGVHTWVIVILYFTFVHSTLVLLGIMALAKAMAGQCWRMPLIGGRLVCPCSGSGSGSGTGAAPPGQRFRHG